MRGIQSRVGRFVGCWVVVALASGESASGAEDVSLTTDHWSFQPVVRPDLPAGDWGRGAIDRFVAARLTEAGLAPSRDADLVTLARRLFLVAHGLPPAAAEVKRFVEDREPGAYERLVDRVLSSPRYGERWARHWFDVVRYADTNGYETNRHRQNAYHYRDYVIDAFNRDLSYDRFIREQLSGDSLDVGVATGFLVAGPLDIVKSPDVTLLQMQRQNELADMVQTTGTAFLGLTIGCARCHDHKFDPILQKDYYSLQAVFAGVTHGDRAVETPDNQALRTELARLEEELRPIARERIELERDGRVVARVRREGRRPMVDPKGNEENFAPFATQRVRFTVEATRDGSAPCIDELQIFNEAGDNVALASAGATATASGSMARHPIHKLAHVNDGRVGNDHSWIADTDREGWVEIQLPRVESVERVVWSRDREGNFSDRLALLYRLEVYIDAAGGGRWHEIANSDERALPRSGLDRGVSIGLLPPDKKARALALGLQVDALREEKRKLESTLTLSWAGTFEQPGPTHVLFRGEPGQEREEVGPDALTVTGTLGMAKDEPEAARRARLAEWIADRENPLTARVLVNRVWHYTFGTGIVSTPSDFGANGTAPSHPDLLEWLAYDFMDGGWSVKKVHRRIFLSSTFRQSSRPREQALAVDAGGRLLWRYPPRRLEAEAIRDSMLHVSGALDLRMGGAGFFLFEVDPENVVHYHPKLDIGPPEWRRMVYMSKVRQEQDAVFGAFDCPDGNQTIARRSRSTTPLQALNLLNSEFTQSQARILARRLESERGSDFREQLRGAYARFFTRSPEPEELADAFEFAREHGIEAICRAFYNSNEFLFVF